MNLMENIHFLHVKYSTLHAYFQAKKAAQTYNSWHQTTKNNVSSSEKKEQF